LYVGRTLGGWVGWSWFVFVIAFLATLYLLLFVGVGLPTMNIMRALETGEF